MDYLVKNLAEFFEILKTAGMNINVSDCITAVEALQYVDILDRSQVRAALKACLVKNSPSRGIFSKAFDLYFVPLETRKEYVARKAEIIEGKKQEVEESAKSLKFQDVQLELTDDLKEVYAALPEIEKRGIRDYLRNTSDGKNVRMEFKQLAETIIRGKLSNLKQKYAEQLVQVEGVLSQDSSEAGILAGEAADSLPQSMSLLHKNISDINEEDVPAAVRLISELVEKLRRELSRKYKKTGKRSRLDLKRTIRANLSTGQVMFRLKYKTRLRLKTKLLLFCDVSASMLRFSSFVLQFMKGMSNGFAAIDSYIFSNDAEKINIKSFYGLADFEAHIKSSAIWGKGTDIGKSMDGILNNRRSPLSSSTVFLIVSDAKTLDFRLAGKNLKDISTRVKRVLWLNPLPEKDWTGIKGLDDFVKYCKMLDCSTLERLTDACRNI